MICPLSFLCQKWDSIFIFNNLFIDFTVLFESSHKFFIISLKCLYNSSQFFHLSSSQIESFSKFLIFPAEIREILIQGRDTLTGFNFIFLSDCNLKFLNSSFEDFILVFKLRNNRFVLIHSLTYFAKILLESSSHFLILLIQSNIILLSILENSLQLIVLFEESFNVSFCLCQTCFVGSIFSIDLNLELVTIWILSINELSPESLILLGQISQI